MSEYLKQGKYSDFTVIFNDKIFQVHIDILADHFEYFESLSKQNFKETNQSNIRFKKLNGDPIDPIYFEYLRNIVYDMRIYDHIFENISITDMIDFHNLTDYLGCKKKVSCFRLSKNIGKNTKLQDIFNSHHYNISYYIFDKICDKIDNQQSDIMSLDCIKHFNFVSEKRQRLNNNMYKKIYIEHFDINTSITCQYTVYILSLLDENNSTFENTVRNIIGITSFELPDLTNESRFNEEHDKFTNRLTHILNQFDRKYYKYIFFALSLRKLY